MTFRWNFLLESVSSMSWVCMNLGFYILLFQYTEEIGDGTGWGKYEFFVFLATTMFVNSIVQTFFMPNMQEFSELIRTGGLDFVLLKPIDAQFLISLQKLSWSSLANFMVGAVLLGYSLEQLINRADHPIELELEMFLLYPFFVGCGVVILYSLMISLAATSIWLGRNQSLYDFWFYITNFSRYPKEIYSGGMIGDPLRLIFTFVIPILIVVNVPARVMAKPLHPHPELNSEWWLIGFAVLITPVSFLASRWVFNRALFSYRSASS